jgi:hypothetical protein
MSNKYSKDPELSLLANQVRHIVWQNPLDETETIEVMERFCEVAGETNRPRNVYPLPGARSWCVRIYLGGDTHTLAIGGTDDLPTLARFADMALEHFWRYKVRGCRPPHDCDLNIRRAQVENDMANEPQALAILQEMEKYLLDTGALKSGATRRKEKKEKLAARLSVRQALLAQLAEIYEQGECILRGQEKAAAERSHLLAVLNDLVAAQTK